MLILNQQQKRPLTQGGANLNTSKDVKSTEKDESNYKTTEYLRPKSIEKRLSNLPLHKIYTGEVTIRSGQ